MSDLDKVRILDEVTHILSRPGVYVGSTASEKQLFWLPSSTKMSQKEIDFIPAQFKVFNEVLDNVADLNIKGTCNEVFVSVDTETGTYSIEDYGPGIAPVKHKESGKYLPELLLTTLRSGSNFGDLSGEKRETIGTNGFGACLTNVFSSTFSIEINRDDITYVQTIKNNNRDIGSPQIIKKKTKQSGTKITFIPDQKIFKKKLPTILIKKRCLELSYVFPTLKINLDIDGTTEVYQGKDFEDFVKLFGNEYQIIDEKKDGFRLALVKSSGEEFSQYSLINGADTHRGGTHIDIIKNLFVEKFKEILYKTKKLEASSLDIAKHLHIVAFLKIDAPSFDSQTKERCSTEPEKMEKVIGEYLTPRKVSSMVNDMPKLLEQIYEALISKNEAKELRELKAAQKDIKKMKVPKFIDASSKSRQGCTIFLTEGDSATYGLAAVRNTKTQGSLPLRGKVLNVLGEPLSKIFANEELSSLMSCIGLEIGKSPISISRGKVQLETLRFSTISILTDADEDGSAIRCLLISFFFKFWPELFEHKIITISEAPLYRVRDKKNKASKFFYEKSDFLAFLETVNKESVDQTYFKGLGGCDKEGWDFFINQEPRNYPVELSDNTKELLEMAFGDDTSVRKEWLR